MSFFSAGVLPPVDIDAVVGGGRESLATGRARAPANPGPEARKLIGKKRLFAVCIVALLMGRIEASLAADADTAQADRMSAPRPLVRIDHIPLAVRDLDRAVSTYRRLGFTIKPGRFHADGIRNMHAKFANGAGLELITAAAPTDDLTRHYLALIAQGDGAAFVGFFASDLVALEGRLDQSGIPYRLDDNILEFSEPALAWPFVLGSPNLAPNDKPEYFQHRNQATATLGVWIAAGNQARSLKLFKAFGASVERRKVYVPDAVLADVATVADGGEAIFLPATRQLLPGRPIVGITLQTMDLDALDRELRSSGVVPTSTREAKAYRSLFLSPRDTCGVWLEFREPR